MIQQLVDLPLNIFDGIPYELSVTDELIMFAQEIYLCFNMEQYECISDTKSGELSIQDMLFNRSVNADAIKSYCIDEIDNNTNLSSLFNYEVDVTFIHGSSRDIVLVDVIVYDTNDIPLKQRFIYK